MFSFDRLNARLTTMRRKKEVPLDQDFTLTHKDAKDGRYRMTRINCLWSEFVSEVARFEREGDCTVTRVVHDYSSKTVGREHWK